MCRTTPHGFSVVPVRSHGDESIPMYKMFEITNQISVTALKLVGLDEIALATGSISGSGSAVVCAGSAAVTGSAVVGSGSAAVGSGSAAVGSGSAVVGSGSASVGSGSAAVAAGFVVGLQRGELTAPGSSHSPHISFLSPHEGLSLFNSLSIPNGLCAWNFFGSKISPQSLSV